MPPSKSKKAKPKTLTYRQAYNALVKAGLAYPEATLDHPWGETALKVKGKIFLFLRQDPDGLFLTIKLPQSREFALEYKFTAPASYGLGRAGWVTAEFEGKAKMPMDLLLFWLRESYQAVAPKKLSALLQKAQSQ
jgi:predicted DNA-binding protein (MmcQ/YjbR family)